MRRRRAASHCCAAKSIQFRPTPRPWSFTRGSVSRSSAMAIHLMAAALHFCRKKSDPSLDEESDIKIIKALGLLATSVLMLAPVRANEMTVVSNVLGPEGPLVVDGTLYYVGWISSTLAKWDGKSNTVLNTTAHCGHNGLALTARKTLLVACDEQGAI